MGGLGGGESSSNIEFHAGSYLGPPLTYFNEGGRGWGRGLSDFFGSVIWPKVFFWVYERCQDFLGSRKKQKDFFGLRKKD